MAEYDHLKAKRWSIAVFIAVCVALFLTLSFSPAIYIDEYWIASMAQRSLGEGIVNNFAFRNFGTGYIDTQPFFTFINGIWIQTFGDSLFVIRFLSALSIIAAALISVSLINRLRNKPSFHYYWLAGMFLLMPILWRTAHINRPESIVLLFVLLAVNLNTFRGETSWKNIVIGFISTFPVFFYVTGVLVAPLVILVWLYTGWKEGFDRAFLNRIIWRVGGIMLGGVLFVLLVGSPVEVIDFFTNSDLSRINVSDESFVKRIIGFITSYLYYIKENAWFYLPALVIAGNYYIRDRSRLKNSTVLFFLLFVVSFLMLAILSRNTPNYRVYSEFFFVVFLLSILADTGEKFWSRVSLGYFLIASLVLVGLYTVYFSRFSMKNVGDVLSENIKGKPVVLARISYKGFFFENDNFLAIEDYTSLLKIGRSIPIDQYLDQNAVEWIVLDEETATKKSLRSLNDIVLRNFKLVSVVNDAYVGSEIYDDVVYEWEFANVWQRITSPPEANIYIYKRSVSP